MLNILLILVIIALGFASVIVPVILISKYVPETTWNKLFKLLN